jgi:uncharacterized protein (TIGR03663 family)
MQFTSRADFKNVTESTLRQITVVFGLGLILLFPLLVDGLGFRASIWAAFLAAISPAMVFYSRYYIHEMLLVFFTGLAIASGWRYWRSRKLAWAVVTGIAVGFMQATKETFVLPLAAAAGALLLNRLANRIFAPPAAQHRPGRSIPLNHILAAIAAWLAVAVLFFSSFCSNWRGVLDAGRTYLPWFERARGASPHVHPWYFYLERLLWFHRAKGPVFTEALIFILALIGVYAAFGGWRLREGRRIFARFIAFYTLLLAIAYCAIGYKTPWCLLGFWHGAILLAGVGAAAFLDRLRNPFLKKILLAVLLAAAVQLAWQARLASAEFSADPRNPYVYAQTSPDVCNLVDEVESLSRLQDDQRRIFIEVVAPDSEYWPLPWYLRKFSNVGWWDKLPGDTNASVMIVSTRLHADDQIKIRGYYMLGIFELRPQTFFELCVKEDLWLKRGVGTEPQH